MVERKRDPGVVCKQFESAPPSMAKKYKTESDNVKTPGVVIIGYVIPDLTPKQAEEEPVIHPSPVFSSEKGLYKKALVSKTLDEAKAKILERYGREQ